jgi:thiol-disulfide isomerase/thioredoxin
MTLHQSRYFLSAWLGLALLLGASGSLHAESRTRLSEHSEPRAVSDIEFKDKHGKELRLSNFKGRVVLLNIWATWCIPCRREMPMLDRLEAKLGSKDFEVIALSIDRAGPPAVESFYKELQIKQLKLYIDQSSVVTRKLAIVGIPTTLLVDREGRELWRVAGEAEWDSDEWVRRIRNAIESKEH